MSSLFRRRWFIGISGLAIVYLVATVFFAQRSQVGNSTIPNDPLIVSAVTATPTPDFMTNPDFYIPLAEAPHLHLAVMQDMQGNGSDAPTALLIRDTRTNQTLKTLIGFKPYPIYRASIDERARVVWVTWFASAPVGEYQHFPGFVGIFDLYTGRLLRLLSIPVTPDDLYLYPSQQRAFIVSEHEDNAPYLSAVIDTKLRRVVRLLPNSLANLTADLTSLHGYALQDSATPRIDVIDLHSGHTVGHLAVRTEPLGPLAFNHRTGYLYVTTGRYLRGGKYGYEGWLGSITAVDTHTGRTIFTQSIGLGCCHIMVDVSQDLILVTSAEHLTTATSGISISRDGHGIPQPDGCKLSVLNGRTGKVLHRLRLSGETTCEITEIDEQHQSAMLQVDSNTIGIPSRTYGLNLSSL